MTAEQHTEQHIIAAFVILVLMLAAICCFFAIRSLWFFLKEKEIKQLSLLQEPLSLSQDKQMHKAVMKLYAL